MQYLGMDAMERVSDQETMVRLINEHEMSWSVPRKPSVSVRVHDAASGERVIGIRYRVMTRPHGSVAPQPRVSFGGTLIMDAAGKVCTALQVCHVHWMFPLCLVNENHALHLPVLNSTDNSYCYGP